MRWTCSTACANLQNGVAITLPITRAVGTPLRLVADLDRAGEAVASRFRRPQCLWRIHLGPLSASPSRVYVAAMPLSAADYWPRDAEHAVLHRVIDEHLEAFLETAKRHTDGSPLPGFVEQEFRDFLTPAVLL